MLRAMESTSDIVQSVCREILQHKDRFQYPGEDGFRRWLYTTDICLKCEPSLVAALGLQTGNAV